VKSAALAAGLPLAQPQTLDSPEARAALAQWQPQVLVVVAYGLILPREVLALPPLGCLNIHASLLPRWRGAAPIQRAILAGDSETGVTIMQMDAGLDTGPVLLQRRLALGASHTSGSLHEALASLGAAALLTALDGLAAGLTARPQPPEGVTYAPGSKRRRRASTGGATPWRSSARSAPSIPGRWPRRHSKVRRCVSWLRGQSPPRHHAITTQ